MVQSEKAKETAAFITSRDTLDGAYPGLVLGINAARLGLETRVFYTFMGINVIRKGWMMKSKIKKAQVPCLGDLQEMAQCEGVKFIACKMTIDMMGFTQEDFIEGVQIQAAEEFLKYATECKICLFT
jgi:peroxiredoxin family protein